MFESIDVHDDATDIHDDDDAASDAVDRIDDDDIQDDLVCNAAVAAVADAVTVVGRAGGCVVIVIVVGDGFFVGVTIRGEFEADDEPCINSPAEKVADAAAAAAASADTAVVLVGLVVLSP